MSAKVTIVDYGAGNLHSVEKAFARLGAEVQMAAEPSAIERAHHLVLPGVGAFGEGMTELGRRGLIEPLRRHAAAGKPLLGICLGAQLLMDGSEEMGWYAGLGLIPGDVRRLPAGAGKIPHVGWAPIYPPEQTVWKNSPLAETAAQTWAYFIHSYQCLPREAQHALAQVAYGSHHVTAAVRRGSIVGLQFHPEKSGQAGLGMLNEFLHGT